MDKKLPLPSQEELLRRYDYSLITGSLYNKKTGKLLTGGAGHMRVTINFVQYKLHRVIWKMITGDEPDFIDHKNSDPRDNSWINLRECTKSQNNCNRGTLGTTPAKNITMRGKKYRVKVNSTYIGTYTSLEDAIVARDEALAKFHGEFANYG